MILFHILKYFFPHIFRRPASNLLKEGNLMNKKSSLNTNRLNSVSENIIGAPNFRYPIKIINFPILVYHSSNFAIAKVAALNLFASFLYRFCRLVHGLFSILLTLLYSYGSSNYWNSISCRSFTLLKAIAKRNGILFAIASKRERAITIAIAIVGRG